MELWLLPAQAAMDALELPGLKRLLARADPLSATEPGLDAALRSVGVTGRIPWAALLAHTPGAAHWMVADLVHARPDMNGARLLACAVDQRDQDHVYTALFESLRPWLAEEGIELAEIHGGRALLRCPSDLTDPATPAPDRLLGCDLREGLPAIRSWQRRINEWQIVLAQHPLNQQRESRGHISWNTLWCWGYGARTEAPALPPHQLLSPDPLLQALSRSASAHGPTWRDLRDPRELAHAWGEGLRPTRALLRADDGAGWQLHRWHRLRIWR